MSSRRGTRWPVALVAVIASCWVAQVGADGTGQDWPQFRGVHRDGVSTETGLLGSWPEAGPQELWRRPLGEGYSAISVVGDRLYTMFAGEHEGQATDFAAAFDAATGNELWRVAIGEKYETEFGNGPRATPTVVGDTVFVLGARGDFAALKAADGSERWRINLGEAFGAPLPHWGFSTSAIAVGSQIILEGGGPEGRLYVGLDADSGKVRWTLGEGRPGYNSALMTRLGGRERIVYVAGGKLTGIGPDGKEAWSHEWPPGETHAMPVFVPPDRIFASGAEGVGGKMFRISEGAGGAKVEELWATRFMRNHFSSSVVHDGHIVGFDNATLKAIAVEDAELAWAKRGLGKGSLILADGRLYVLSDRGKLVLLEASSAGYVEKGSVQALEGLCWTAPSLAHGRLYLRNHEEMVAYRVKG